MDPEYHCHNGGISDRKFEIQDVTLFQNRYSDAYINANSNESFGNRLVAFSGCSIFVLLIIALPISDNCDVKITALCIFAIFSCLIMYLAGIMISGFGKMQILLTDISINSSPILSIRNKIKIISGHK